MALGTSPEPDDSNPYLAPASDLALASEPYRADALAEEIRREHLGHEAAIRSLGALFYLFGILAGVASAGAVLFGVIVALSAGWNAQVLGPDAPPPVLVAIGVVYGFIALIQFAIGRGLRRLENRTRWLVVVLNAPLLLLAGLGAVRTVAVDPPAAFGMLLAGGLVPLLILVLLLSEKAAMIFSADYREIIEETPHLRPRLGLPSLNLPRWGRLTWLALLLAVLFVVAMAVSVLVG